VEDVLNKVWSAVGRNPKELLDGVIPGVLYQEINGGAQQGSTKGHDRICVIGRFCRRDGD
jgi:hypothetical protein